MMSWCEHLLDRCCYCWCGFHDDEYYDDDTCKDKDIGRGTMMITLSDKALASNNNDEEDRDKTLSSSSSMERMIRVDFDVESSSDSVQDDLYYDDYAVNKYTKSIESDDKRVIQACKMLEIARTTLNTSTNQKNLDRQKMDMICMCYEQSIGTLHCQQQPSLKRRIIKEYEYVRRCVPNELLRDRQIEIDELLSRARRMDCEIEERKKMYRSAIKLVVNIDVKKKLKTEYNQFLLLSASVNK